MVKSEQRIARVEGVVQARMSTEEPWSDMGSISGVGLEWAAFERALKIYLAAYRRSFPDMKHTRAVERTVTWTDREMEF